uniref:Immunoglobulin domain-containing protein n=1 Tax=Erpetoichthys calabaricus TaxID=27687 RepID=A0A8C4SI78_ERPCA
MWIAMSALYLLLNFFLAEYSVTTESKMSATEGMTLNILCRYDKQRYRRHVKYWCKGNHWRTCAITKRSDDPQNGDPGVLIHDDKQGLFRVVLSNLKRGDTNWYWCGIEIEPGIDDMASVFLTVTAGKNRWLITIFKYLVFISQRHFYFIFISISFGVARWRSG